jgi:hypothetical protein
LSDFLSVEKFEVFHLWCEQMRPEAKHKLVVVVHVAADYVLGFVINSRLNEFVLERPHLLPCHAELLCDEHPLFLTHDSFVDCQTPYTFPRVSLIETSRRGFLGQSAQMAVLEAVRFCVVLKPVHKKLILVSQ